MSPIAFQVKVLKAPFLAYFGLLKKVAPVHTILGPLVYIVALHKSGSGCWVLAWEEIKGSLFCLRI
jgi:hypothetical protein